MPSKEVKGLWLCLVLTAMFLTWKVRYANDKISTTGRIVESSSSIAKATRQSLLNSTNCKSGRWMTERLDLKSEACKLLAVNKDLQSIKNSTKGYKPLLMYSKKYNVSYCGVGKTGGTFIRQLFSIFMLGENVAQILENTTRMETHVITAKFDVNFNSNAWRQSKLITVSRNPYTRLFSSYIDKIFLPSVLGPIRQGSDCKYDVSYLEFLKIIVQNTKAGKMDAHWSPIYHICSPCDVVSTFIVKQESYIDDLKIVIESLNLTDKLRAAVDKKLDKPQTLATVKGTTKELIDTTRKAFAKPGCIGWYGAVKRLWKSFQIQGYINENIDLPIDSFNQTDDFSNEKLIVDTIVNTMQKYPLTKKEAKDQRRRSLVRAYSQVDRQTIENIQKIFEPDFKMFGYSLDPPV